MLKGPELFQAVKDCPHEAAFWWLGQHTFIVKLGPTRAVIDPFLSPLDDRLVPPLFQPEDAAGVLDLVLCTHDHLDHIDPVAVTGLAEKTNAPFVAPRAHRQRMLSLGVPPNRLLLLDDGEAARCAGIEIHAVKAAHEFFDRTPEGWHPFLGYVLTGAGKTVYHAGDTVWWEGLQARLSAWTFDLALVPINGRDADRYARDVLGNMTFQEAADLVGGLDVALTVPAHYDMFAYNAEDPDKFRKYMQVKYPDKRVRLAGYTETIPF